MSDTTGKSPPMNLDAEAAVLSASLLSFEAFDRARALLEPSAFYAVSNRLIWEAACAVADAGSEPDMVTVAGWIKANGRIAQAGGTAYISQVVEATPALARIEDYARMLRDLGSARQLLRDMQVLEAEAYAGIAEPREWIERCEQAVFAATTQPHETPAAEWIGEVAIQIYNDSRDTVMGKLPPGRSTGIPELDELTGGMGDGSVWYFAGRPGMGKSAMAETTCRAIASGNAQTPGELVAVFSMEMPRKQVTRRAAARDALINYTELKKGSLDHGQWRKYASFLDRAHKLPIKLDDTPDMSPARIRARLRRYIAEARRTFRPDIKLGAVVCDYLQLMSSDEGSGEGRVAQLESITRALKRIAREFDCVMIVPCQVNRATEAKVGDKRPTLGELRGSGSIEQDADFVIGLYREDYYRKPEEQRDGVVELIVLKGRESETGTVLAKWDGPTTRFYSEAADRAACAQAALSLGEPDAAE